MNSPNKGKKMVFKTGFEAVEDVDIPKLVAPILKGEADTVNDSRYLSGHTTDMPVYYRLGQTILDKIIMNICIQKCDRFLNIYLMFVSIFIFRLPFIFQGFQASDFGYHMTHQVFSFTFSPEIKYIEPMYFLADFVGGMWLSIIGHPSVLWARLGGVLLGALNAVIVFPS